MKKFLILLFLYFASLIGAFAQPSEACITITSEVNIGENLAFEFATDTTNIYWIDWGNGKLKEYIITYDRYGIHGDYQSKPKLGDTVKIYCNSLTGFTCTNNKITSLNLKGCYSLVSLYCSQNMLDSLSFYWNYKLSYVNCNNNNLTYLNIEGAIGLKELYCSNNKLSYIAPKSPNNTRLQTLQCANNKIKSLDFIQIEDIYDLDIQNNLFTKIDVSYCFNLTNLNCANNYLSELNVDNNSNLSTLDFSNNNISEIDVSHAKSLYSISCDYNKLKLLDLYKNYYLENIRCSHNQIAILNLPKYCFYRDTYPPTFISYIDCSFNKIDSTFQIPEQVLLGYPNYKGVRDWSINCSNNLIKAIKPAHESKIVNLDCSNNLIEILDLSKITYCSPTFSLQNLNCSNNGMKQLLLAKNYENSLPSRIYCDNNNLKSLNIPDINLRILSLMNNQLNKDKLNSIYNQLQDIKQTSDTAKSDKHLTITNNPGTSESNKSTALQKGWIIDSNFHNIKISQNIAEGGFEIGGGSYSDSSKVNVRACAKNNYIFQNWTENGIVVSDKECYTFKAIKDITLEANYQYKEMKKFTVNVSVYPSDNGIVNGDGVYSENVDVSIYSDPVGYYEFVNWTENGKVLSTSKNYAFTINSDRNLVANFIKTYCKVKVSGDAKRLVLEGSGIYERGATVTIKATALPGYMFLHWSPVQGATIFSSTYQFIIEQDQEFWAWAEESNYSSIPNSEIISFNVYPNPTADFISINNTADNEPIEILSMSGEVLLNSTTPYKIDVKSLSQGTYFIKYKNQIGKFVKL